MLQNGRAMRSTLRVLLAAVVAVPVSFGAASNASAQSVEVSGSLGGYIFSADNELGRVWNNDDSPSPFVTVAPRLTIALSDLLKVEAEVGFTPTTAGDASMMILSWRSMLRFDIVHGTWTPFVTAGLGANWLVSADDPLDSGDTDMGPFFGGGTKWALGENWGARFDARVHLVPGVPDGDAVPEFEVLAGLYWGFGGSSDEEDASSEMSDEGAPVEETMDPAAEMALAPTPQWQQTGLRPLPQPPQRPPLESLAMLMVTASETGTTPVPTTPKT